MVNSFGDLFKLITAGGQNINAKVKASSGASLLGSLVIPENGITDTGNSTEHVLNIPVQFCTSWSLFRWWPFGLHV
jgi:hypothetical protein